MFKYIHVEQFRRLNTGQGETEVNEQVQHLKNKIENG